MEKKKELLILGILIAILSVVGVSYALWQLTIRQEGINTVATSCFSITFEEAKDSSIHLDQAYPMKDEEGAALTPYTFKIKNNCGTYAKYNVALEIINNTTLSSEFLKVKVDTNMPQLLNSYSPGTTTLENTKESYILDDWYLYENEEKTYELRLWLDGNITAETEGVQNKLWESIVTVNVSYAEEAPKSSGTLRVVNSSTNDGMWKYRDSITKIVIQNELKEVEGSIQPYDESTTQDGSVMSYIVPNEDNTTYTAYLQSNRKLILNENSSILFSSFSKVKTIVGMEYLDTSKVFNMNYMFYSCANLATVDLRKSMFTNITEYTDMFNVVKATQSINIIRIEVTLPVFHLLKSKLVKLLHFLNNAIIFVT